MTIALLIDFHSLLSIAYIPISLLETIHSQIATKPAQILHHLTIKVEHLNYFSPTIILSLLKPHFLSHFIKSLQGTQQLHLGHRQH